MLSIPFEKHTLNNGLDVIVHSDRSIPVAAVNVWYHVGSKNETPGKTGFAHLFEHVMFEGSKHHNKDYFEPLQEIGANINGSTTNDRTNYWEDIPSNYLELALWLESDRMGFLLEALDENRFNLQRDVVKNERRQSYENRPYGMSYLKIQEALFPPPHPYNWPTIGSQEDLDNASVDDVKEFFRNFYHPSNASLSIVGDVEPQSVFKLVEKYFGDIEPGPSIERLSTQTSTLRGETNLILEDNIQLPRLYLAWPVPEDFTREQAALDILSVILADGRSSRLERKLLYENQTAHDIRVFNHAQEISGEFHIIATAGPNNSLETIQDELLKSLEEIKSHPPTEKEMMRAQNRIENYHIRQLEKLGGFGGKADQLNMYNVMAGNPDLINHDIARYRETTGDDVSNAAKLLGDHRINLKVLPKSKYKTAIKSVDRNIQPKPSTQITYEPPTPSKFELENGSELIVIEKNDLPIAQVGLLINKGATSDPDKYPGLTKFTAEMLVEGTKSKKAEELASELEHLGTRLSKDVSREHSFFSVDCLTKNIDASLLILADVVSNPIFPIEEFERLKNEHISDLTAQNDNPDFLASTIFRKLLYASNPKYGHPISGDINSVQNYDVETIKKQYKKIILDSKPTFIAAGNFNTKELIDQINNLFNAPIRESHIAGQEVTYLSNKDDNNTPKIYIIDRPDSAQSVIRAGHITLDRKHADYYSLAFVNYILGGDYSSRLNLNLRQDKGYSYGFYSNIDWSLVPSLWGARGSVQTEVTSEAVKEIIFEVEGIAKTNPISKEEFTKAKEGLIKSIPSQFESTSQIMNQLINMSIFDLKTDYFKSISEKLNALTLEQVQDSAQKHIDPRGIIIVVAGDRELIESPISELGYPVSIVTSDGQVEHE